MSYILSIITFLPLVGAILIFFMNDSRVQTEKNAKYVAIFTSIVTFFLSFVVLWMGYDDSQGVIQYTEGPYYFVPGLKAVAYEVGVDGISVLFVLLTTILVPICILSAQSITTKVREFLICFLLLETFMIGTFVAQNIILFYVFFEAVLIPMFFIIGIWGGKRRIYASFKLFLYTLLGSILMLIAIIFLLVNYPEANGNMYKFAGIVAEQHQTVLWFAFFVAFAVKMPMWPVHTWLPDAHVEAPTAGSVILAGVLLKFGAYGFIRILLPILPEASQDFAWLVMLLSMIAVVYTSLVALVQEDMKKLIAYSSIAHMGFVTAGIFAFNRQGVEGAIFQSLSHGVVSGALFLIVGVVYDRVHSRQIADYGGLVERMPKYAFVFMVFMMASIGLPGTSGFVGEFLILLGLFQVNVVATTIIALGVILGAAYMLWLYRRVIFGSLTNTNLSSIKDLFRFEVIVFAPLLFLTIWMGVYPKPILDKMHNSVDVVISHYNQVVEEQQIENLVVADTSETDDSVVGEH